jgi:ABC-2 type transport system permease protein
VWLRSNAYLAYATAGARQEVAARPALVGRAAFLVVILFVFSRLWDRVFAAETLGGRTQGELLWYIAVTEWIVLSFPYIHVEMENDLRSGDLVARLSQPVSYVGARLAEAAGGAVVRLGLFGLVAASVAAVFTGGLPASPGGLLLAVPLGLMATALALLTVGAIGMCAVWLHDTSPVFWIWQKLAFMFGGLLLPLDVYPGWLQRVAAWTPFAAMINGPGRMALGFEPLVAARLACELTAWLLVGAVGLRWLSARALRAIDGHGG